MEYSYENWLKVNDVLNLSHDDLAAITATQDNNIKVQLRPSKKLPTWIRTLIYGYNKGISTNTKVDDLQSIRTLAFYECGCSKLNGIFKRTENCKVDAALHKL